MYTDCEVKNLDRISIGKEITMLARQIRLLRGRYLEEAGCIVGQAQFHALMYFARNEGSSEKQAAQAVGIDKTLMTRAVKKLQHMGLLTVRRDSKDARYKRVWMTDAGKREMVKVRAALAGITDTLASGLNEQQIGVFLQTLEIMKNNIADGLGQA